MSKLNVDQKSIMGLFQDNKSDFLIPDYQRPYAWEEKECRTLWEDIFSFAFPDNNYQKFDKDKDEYFLGPIVTFKNEDGKLEVIDGQQRLTTLLLLLRAFYGRYANMKDNQAIKTRENIEKCIWKTDEFGNPDMQNLKIDSQVATDNDKEEFLSILRTGIVEKGQKSRYAENFKYFEGKINEFLQSYPSYFSYLPIRILNNCIILPIEADSQDTALRIFSTLNDRGKPLSDADIFKAQFYKFFSSCGKKDYFIKLWKSLEEVSERVFHPIYGTPMDELFTRYMYYERALMENKSSTTESLRKFYERDGYELLHRESTLENLVELADFWKSVETQDTDRFSEKVLRKLFVLNYAPNGMWAYITSVYFMTNKDADGMLDDDAFYRFLNIITGFIWTYAVTNPGVNSLRTPIYAEMVNIVKGNAVTFNDFKFDRDRLKSQLSNFNFYNGRPITKSMLTWWAFTDDSQTRLALEIALEIEHIYSRARVDKENSLSDKGIVEMLGNKSILEQKVNIRASDYRFVDKKKYYEGYENARGQKKEGTQISELIKMARNADDFTEADIIARDAKIKDTFIDYLHTLGLLL